jgi:MFS family permease
VLIASANYSFVALVDIVFRALQPVFFSTPIELGGLGLDPPVIGTILSAFGILDGLFTLFFFSPLVDYFGVRKVYLIGIICAAPSFALFPVIGYLARASTEHSGGLGTEVWFVVGVQVVLSVVVYVSYGASVSNAGVVIRFP